MATNLINLPTLWRGNKQGSVQSLPDYQIHKPEVLNKSPSLSSILTSFGPFPVYSLVIGMCTDGLPFMLSLNNPKSGSILVVGENSLQKTQILQTMIHSACRINQPNEVNLGVITNNPEHYTSFLKSQHCQTIVSPYERAAGEMVIEYASICEQRRSGRERGAALMLLIDDYQSFSPQLEDYSVYLNLKTLIAHGPKSCVWPLISINPADVHSSKGHLLRSFGTYIFEKVIGEGSHLPPIELARSSGAIFEPNFNVIIGGRLIPISSLSD
jgi:hypothetical protein